MADQVIRLHNSLLFNELVTQKVNYLAEQAHNLAQLFSQQAKEQALAEAGFYSVGALAKLAVFVTTVPSNEMTDTDLEIRTLQAQVFEAQALLRLGQLQLSTLRNRLSNLASEPSFNSMFSHIPEMYSCIFPIDARSILLTCREWNKRLTAISVGDFWNQVLVALCPPIADLDIEIARDSWLNYSEYLKVLQVMRNAFLERKQIEFFYGYARKYPKKVWRLDFCPGGSYWDNEVAQMSKEEAVKNIIDRGYKIVREEPEKITFNPTFRLAALQYRYTLKYQLQDWRK